MIKKIAILLDGPIRNDGRVRRIIESLSKENAVDLFYTNGSVNDQNLFTENVRLFQYSFHDTWLNRNILFHKKFVEAEKLVLQQNIDYDFIYCNDYPLLYTSVNLKDKLAKSRLIYDSHEIYIETINQFFPIKGWKSVYGYPLIMVDKVFHKRLERKLVSKVDFFVTVCESFKEYFEREYQIKNISIVQNCPKLKDYPIKNDFIRQLLGLTNDDFILLYQGNINPGRGLEKMIDLSTYLKNHQHIVIIGNGYLLMDLQKRAQNNNSKNIHFIGEIPFNELLQYTASADIGVMFIQPINRSKELTLPNKVFEYMAAGIPVLTNRLPEAKRLVEELDCGYSINDDNLLDIALFLDELESDKETLKLKGSNGQKAIKLHYNWENQIQKIVDIIKT